MPSLRLPYRLRNWIDQRRIVRAVAGLKHTAPTPAVAPEQAPAEVHMLLCRRDLAIGVLALKSLLRFTECRWAVSLSDDGSLTAAERARVDHHIPGARWLIWPELKRSAQIAGLEKLPRLTELYRSSYAPVCKLLHATLQARRPRVLVLDPDTAFFALPQRLIDFAQGRTDVPLYLHDHQDETRTVPPEVNRAFMELARTLAPPGWNWRLSHRLFNSGLLAFRPADLDLNLAEAYLAWRDKLPMELRTGKPAIWFGDWTPEQTCYHVMFALQSPERSPAEPLGEDYHLGGEAGHVFNHFLRHYLVQPATHARLKKLVKELPGSER